jgi:hypothetical protein
VAEAGPAYDLWLAYLLARGGGAAVYVPQRLAGWRTHAGSLSHAAGDAWLRGAARCWDAMAADPAFAAHRALVAPRRARAWTGCARLALRRGRLGQALADTWRAVRPPRAEPVGRP